jgi:hypothetical protein
MSGSTRRPAVNARLRPLMVTPGILSITWQAARRRPDIVTASSRRLGGQASGGREGVQAVAGEFAGCDVEPNGAGKTNLGLDTCFALYPWPSVTSPARPWNAPS